MKTIDELNTRIAELEKERSEALQGVIDMSNKLELATVDRFKLMEENKKLQDQSVAMQKMLSTPEMARFLAGFVLEAVHQRLKWGDAHDAGKTAADWALLFNYIQGKIAAAVFNGTEEKLKHHLITLAAICYNYHRTLPGTKIMPGERSNEAGLGEAVQKLYETIQAGKALRALFIDTPSDEDRTGLVPITTDLLKCLRAFDASMTALDDTVLEQIP
jgi:hypothetical protein